MTFIQTYLKEIISLLAPLITLALNRVFRAKVKLRIANALTPLAIPLPN